MLLTELGMPHEEVFRNFPEKPIASGSIAQVYQAEIRLDLIFIRKYFAT
jgi:predicted unusual protein kinase regulating ubiquinone biosynthesis (AarF/ABC1/UbiB family)